jgi:glutamyl-tRNA(Gln) amidotransferase subunit D
MSTKRLEAKEGSKVEFFYNGEKVSGVVIPSKENILNLKLDSGYNAGFDVSKIKGLKNLGKAKKVGKAKKIEIKKNPNLKTISILHTGGTIASRVNYETGGVETSFEPEDLLTMFPKLMEVANVKSKLVRNMWSDDLRLEHLEVIAKAIEKEIEKGTDGIIVGMGTDNLAIASAGISFAIEKSPVPIIFVGAQRSSDRGSSDAEMNLVCAAEFITKSDFSGVALCMHNSINDNKCAVLPATKTRKMHTSRRDAFKPINSKPIALVDYKTRKIEFLEKNYSKRYKGKAIIKPKFETKIGLLKIYVGMFKEQFEFFSKQKFKGLVIEGTGLGHTPGQMPDEITKKYHKGIYSAIKKFVDSGGVVVMTSQCINGRINMNVYNKGRDLLNLGVLQGEDMLAETAFVKLAWLLANEPKKVKELVGKDLRGEISKYSKVDVYNPEI